MSLHALLADPALQRLWTLVRGKLEGLGLEARGVVTIADPTPEERDAVAGLLGLRRTRSGPLRIRLAVLDRELRASGIRVGLVDAMRRLGPLVDRRAERLAAGAEREAVIDRARTHPALDDRGELAGFLDDLQASGLVWRLTADTRAGEELLESALDILSQLPGSGVRIAVLASEATGDPHALDHGRGLATLVLRGLALMASRAYPATASERRLLWSWAGVLCHDLSADVLVLNLPATGDGLLARWLREFGCHGEPMRVTLRQLADPQTVPPATLVHVCENPLLISEASDRLGAGSPALVCLEGMPTTAGLLLLDHLSGCGAQLRYHGDFDWGGVRIGNLVFGRVPAMPWRYGAADYAEAAARTGNLVPLRGGWIDAVWDPDLAPAMARTGGAVYEEQVLEDLVDDLEHG